MLQIIIPEQELWDEKNQQFLKTKAQTLKIEHSLVSLSKWESKWCKAFLGKEEKTIEEIIDYIKCMTLTQNVNPNVYNLLTDKNIEDINAYIEAPMTAYKWYSDESGGKINKEQITAELIYYWMITLNIPFECQKWHLNRLLTLIRVINLKNSPPEKLSRSEIIARNQRLNKQRRAKLNSKG